MILKPKTPTKVIFELDFVKVIDVNYGSPGTMKVQVRAKNSDPQALESFAYYIRDGKIQSTNAVNCNIRVIP